MTCLRLKTIADEIKAAHEGSKAERWLQTLEPLVDEMLETLRELEERMEMSESEDEGLGKGVEEQGLAEGERLIPTYYEDRLRKIGR